MDQAPKVHIDCPCDTDYIKKEIPFINYVRDRLEAQVHVLVTVEPTGSGGSQYTLDFIGQQDFTNLRDTLHYRSRPLDTQEKIRSGLVKILKLGLVRYLAKTPLADQVSVSLDKPMDTTSVKDKWDYWVFSAGLNTYLSGQQSARQTYFSNSVSARRVTTEWKTSLSANTNYSENSFDVENRTITSISRSHGFNGSQVKGLGEHWSLGLFGSANSSTFGNTKSSLDAAPGVEYNIFPYSQSTRRRWSLVYKLHYSHFEYAEETVFDKLSESLWNEALSVTLNAKERWGSSTLSIEGSHYLHDFTKKRLDLLGSLSLQIWEGLSINISGSYSMIRDQISLPKGSATLEDILLYRKELASHFNYSTSFGLSYTFGSIYSNVVNPRF